MEHKFQDYLLAVFGGKALRKGSTQLKERIFSKRSKFVRVDRHLDERHKYNDRITSPENVQITLKGGCVGLRHI